MATSKKKVSKRTSKAVERGITRKPPSKNHYVRVNSPGSLRLYVTNAALREIPPSVVQSKVMDLALSAKNATATRRYTAGGPGKTFTVRVNPGAGEAHVQLEKES